MQADHGHIAGGKQLAHPYGLRQTVRDTSRAKHLESVQHDHAAGERFERDRQRRVEPLTDLQRRRRRVEQAAQNSPSRM
ncbi:MAG: hypothetical protein ABI478_10375 [Propionivibrio sp.]